MGRKGRRKTIKRVAMQFGVEMLYDEERADLEEERRKKLKKEKAKLKKQKAKRRGKGK